MAQVVHLIPAVRPKPCCESGSAIAESSHLSDQLWTTANVLVAGVIEKLGLSCCTDRLSDHLGLQHIDIRALVLSCH